LTTEAALLAWATRRALNPGRYGKPTIQDLQLLKDKNEDYKEQLVKVRKKVIKNSKKKIKVMKKSLSLLQTKQEEHRSKSE